MELHTKWHVRQHLPNVQISYNSKKSPDALFLDSFAIAYTVFYFLFKTNCAFWKRLFWTIFISSPCQWKRHVSFFRKASLRLQTRKVPFSCAVYFFLIFELFSKFHIELPASLTNALFPKMWFVGAEAYQFSDKTGHVMPRNTKN